MTHSVRSTPQQQVPADNDDDRSDNTVAPSLALADMGEDHTTEFFDPYAPQVVSPVRMPSTSAEAATRYRAAAAAAAAAADSLGVATIQVADPSTDVESSEVPKIKTEVDADPQVKHIPTVPSVAPPSPHQHSEPKPRRKIKYVPSRNSENRKKPHVYLLAPGWRIKSEECVDLVPQACPVEEVCEWAETVKPGHIIPEYHFNALKTFLVSDDHENHWRYCLQGCRTKTKYLLRSHINATNPVVVNGYPIVYNSDTNQYFHACDLCRISGRGRHGRCSVYEHPSTGLSRPSSAKDQQQLNKVIAAVVGHHRFKTLHKEPAVADDHRTISAAYYTPAPRYSIEAALPSYKKQAAPQHSTQGTRGRNKRPREESECHDADCDPYGTCEEPEHDVDCDLYGTCEECCNADACTTKDGRAAMELDALPGAGIDCIHCNKRPREEPECHDTKRRRTRK